MTESDVLKLIEREIVKAGSAMALARRWGISMSYLCDVRRRRRSIATARILEPLGLVMVQTYRRMK